MVCEGAYAHVTWQEMVSTLGSSYGYSRLDASTLIRKGVAAYCPEYNSAIAGIDSGSSTSEPGDQGDLFARQLNRMGISIDKDTAVDLAKTACKSPLEGTGLYNAYKAMQQRYPQYDINTIARVMSQGIVAYCPNRLG